MKATHRQLGGLGFILGVLFLAPQFGLDILGVASAQDASLPQSISDPINMLLVGAQGVLKALYALLIPILGLIGKFLSNDWVMGTLFDIDVIIEVIWGLVRNLVNVGIVLYLVVLAGANMLPGKSKMPLSSKLPRVIAALVLVNFSLFFCRTILSVSNLATTLAFSIPNEVTGTIFDDTISKDYNPFVWVQPLSTGEQSRLACSDANGVPLNFYSLIKEEDAADKSAAGAVATGGWVCERPSDEVLNKLSSNTTDNTQKTSLATARGSARYLQPNPNAQIGQSLYQVECLHRNYAFNFDRIYAAETGSTLIANPVLVGSTYQAGPNHHKRFVFSASSLERLRNNTRGRDATGQREEDFRLSGVQVFDETNNPTLTVEELLWNRTVLIAEQRDGNLQFEFNETLPDGQKSVGVGVPFPYYSDCILTMDELLFSSRNAMFVYAFNLMKIANFEDAFTNVASAGDIMVRTLISVAYLAIFFLINIGMLIAVVGRGFFIWAMMILSPAWLVAELIQFNNSSSKNGMSAFNAMSFTKLAFLPALIGLVLSLGFIMFHFLNYVGTIEGISAGRLQVGSITLLFNPSGAIIGGLGNIFQMMFAFLAMAAIWMGVMWAFKFGFKGNPWMTKLLDRYEGFGNNALMTTAKVPLNLPIIPTGTGRKISMEALRQVPSKYMESVKDERKKKVQGQLANIPWINPQSQLENSAAKSMAATMSAATSSKDIESILRDLQKYQRDPDVKLFYNQLLSQLYDNKGRVRDNVNSVKVNLQGHEVKIKGDALKGIKTSLKADTALGKLYANSGLYGDNNMGNVNRAQFDAMWPRVGRAVASGAAPVPTTTNKTQQAANNAGNQNAAKKKVEAKATPNATTVNFTINNGSPSTVNLTGGKFSDLKTYVTQKGATVDKKKDSDIVALYNNALTQSGKDADASKKILHELFGIPYNANSELMSKMKAAGLKL